MREQWAYLAGLLENGGWIGTRGTQPGIELTAARDVITKVARFTGVGTSAPAARGPQNQGAFSWSVTDGDVVAWILTEILPFLSQSRAAEAQYVLQVAYQ